MDLSQLLKLIEHRPEFQKLAGLIRQNGAGCLSAIPTAWPYLLAAIQRVSSRPILFITARPEEARRFYEQLAPWCPGVTLLHFPEPDALPYERLTPDLGTVQARIRALSRLNEMSWVKASDPPLSPLIRGKEGFDGSGTGGLIIVASVYAVVQKTIAKNLFAGSSLTVRTGDTVEIAEILGRFDAMGYEPEATVEVPGTFSRRGGIIDVYPYGNTWPIRLELAGKQIETLRYFDPATQRSRDLVREFTIEPALEMAFPVNLDEALAGWRSRLQLEKCSAETRQKLEEELELLKNRQRFAGMAFYAPLFNTDTILDYLPAGGLLVFEDLSRLEGALDDLEEKAGEVRQSQVERGELPPGYPTPYLSCTELRDRLRSRLPRVEFTVTGPSLAEGDDRSVPGEFLGDRKESPLWCGQPQGIAPTELLIDRKESPLWCGQPQGIVPTVRATGTGQPQGIAPTAGATARDCPEGAGSPFLQTVGAIPCGRPPVQPREGQDEGPPGCCAFDFEPAPSYSTRLPNFIKDLERMKEESRHITIVSHQAPRLSDLLGENEIIAAVNSDLKELPARGDIKLVKGMLDGGWVFRDDGEEYVLFTDREIFGFIKQGREVKKRPVRRLLFLSELEPGDFVVHVDHGVARFAGTTRLTADGTEREFLILEYAGEDKLYVPVEQIDRVTRYMGARSEVPNVSRLGTQEWRHTRQRVKEAVEKIAKELLELYAARELKQGYAFSPDTVWQQELEASFPYVETPDQIEAIRQVKEDMEKTRPMDRLVCGDVGYGKTEVALRAAFKCVMEGRQVAMLVPTTILAQQHYNTFTERLKSFPMKVAMLSRFCSEKEQRATVEELAEGTVDICIGTHRLLQKDIGFKNLGLVIIDEEQRFGVMHKEHFKKMRQEVDVLTLSATPIPRTLHMALVSVRDMSTMETPPEERLPIKTLVGEFHDRIVREAILRELERDGQVFFVHNRVKGISAVADHLRKVIPEARIGVGHGQMPEDTLENVMLDFSQQKFNVLVCTTIIESGLDMPNVNTLIVNDADKLGLTQLYQLRGRVGRGTHRAYAYFLYKKGKRLTPQAEKRLQAIFEATELGAGFRLAMKDLEIRGAGNLLGTEQSGQISAVGFELYTQLLTEAVENLKAARTPEEKAVAVAPKSPLPPVELPLSAYIPITYVSDMGIRLNLYQRMTGVADEADILEISKELADRFGKPPAPARNLLYVLKIRTLARQAGLSGIGRQNGHVVLRFQDMARWAKKPLKGNYDGLKITYEGLTLPAKPAPPWQDTLEKLLRELAALNKP